MTKGRDSNALLEKEQESSSNMAGNKGLEKRSGMIFFLFPRLDITREEKGKTKNMPPHGVSVSGFGVRADQAATFLIIFLRFLVVLGPEKDGLHAGRGISDIECASLACRLTVKHSR